MIPSLSFDHRFSHALCNVCCLCSCLPQVLRFSVHLSTVLMKTGEGGVEPVFATLR